MKNLNTDKEKSLFSLKFDLKMKLTTFLLIITLFNVQANNYAQNTKITLNLENVRIENVLMEIESLTDFKFFFSREDIDVTKIVSVKAEKEKVKNILENIFRNMTVSFEVLDKQIILKEKLLIQKTSIPVIKEEIQQKQISGTITDTNGMPLPGASIIVKGTNIGTTTDFDGNFKITIEDNNKTLVISYMGFKTQEVIINNQTFIKVILVEDAAALDEVVLIGYGTQQKTKITGAIAQLSLGDIEDIPVSNFDQALAGKLAGVQVVQTNGEPGRELTIKVRGTKTLTAGANPLYVVDGVPIESAGQATEAVNMEDIESIQILKDAASAAIYGSRGSNGVVLISTKKGRQGEMRVNFSHSTGFQNVSKKIDMMDAYEYAQISKDGHDAAYLQEVPTGSASDPNSVRGVGYYKIPEELFPYLNGEEGLTNTDWQDEIFRSAIIQRYNLSVNGGNEKWNYFISTNHSFQEGIVIKSDYRKTGLRANVSVNSGKFKIGLNLSPSYTLENRVNASGPYFDNGIVASALSISPTWSVYNEDGSYNYRGNGLWRIGTDYQHNEILNPVALANEIQDEIEHYNILGNLFLEYELLKDLKLKSSLAFNYNNYQNEYYKPSSLQDRGANFYNQLSNADGRLSTTTIYKLTFENTANYKKQIGLHNFDVLGGITVEQSRSNSLRVSNSLTPDIPISNTTQIINTPSLALNSTASVGEWSLFSLLARVQYDYDSKYLLSASYRADGSSRFAANNKWGYFPSVSAGWRISKEQFLENTNWISELKLRTSYGLTGNFNIGNYSHLALLGQDNYLSEIGLKPNNVGNDDLSWETTAMFNVALDVELFDKQLGFTIEYYNGNTSDLLLDIPVPQTTGFGSALQNIGKVNNKGYEFGLKIAPDLGQFKWVSNLNISFNENEVLELGPEGTPIIETAGTGHAFFKTEIGQPIGNYFLLIQDGIFSTQEELNQYPHFSNTAVGDFRFVDVDGDGVMDVNNDRAIVGNYAPDFTYGISNSFNYKGIDLNIALQGIEGGEVLNLSRRYIANGEGNFNNTREMLDRWQSETNPGDGNTNRANRKSKGNNGRTSTWHIEDASYLRIQNVSIGYSLPTSILEKLNFDKVRIYLTGSNIYTWSNYSGFNPEVNNNDANNQLTPGLDYGTYPLSTTYSLGINLSF